MKGERECVHVGDNGPFSTPLIVLLAHSWHTAGHPSQLPQPLSSHSAPSTSNTTLPPYRMPDMHGKEWVGWGWGVKTEKTLTLMGTRKEEVMMGPTAPKIHLGLGRRGSISDRQVFLRSHTNPCLASPLSGPQGPTPSFHCSH